MTKASFLLRTCGLASVITLAWLTTAFIMLPTAPNQIAVHFSSNGIADGFTSPLTFILISGLSCLSCLLLMGITVINGASIGKSAHFLGGITLWTATFFGIICLDILTMNKAATDSTLVTYSWSRMMLSVSISLLAFLIGWFIVRPTPSTAPEVEVPKLKIPATGTAAWIGGAEAPTFIKLLGFSATLAILIPAIFVPFWWMILLVVMMILVFITLLNVKVLINDTGITWRMTGRVFHKTIPWSQIQAVDYATINIGDWGGWGYRVNTDGSAILIRAGEGLKIQRTTGKPLFITVDDASTAVAAAAHHLR